MPDIVAFGIVNIKILDIFVIVQKGDRFVVMDLVEFQHAQPALEFIADHLDAVFRPGAQCQAKGFQALPDIPQLTLQRTAR